ncbi:MAG: glycosyltransferase family 2 protein [Lachnospiraceae bacterium]|nr:glycosyltransferase family 2 protein [Lachnospiraceae bacterium]
MFVNFKLSIIVPVYNGETHIENTVRSILNSSYQNLELLLIDDGSTDGSLALCQKLSESDSRIKVYHKENGGIGAARNFGLAHATGNYIGFCDQDDEISEEMYQKMLTRIVSDGSQAAICSCYRQKRNGGKVVFEQYTDNVYDGQLIVGKLLLPMLFKGFAAHANHEISIYMSIWKCIISRQLIDDNAMEFRTFVTHEDDFIMLLQLFLHAEKISTLSDILYFWNTNTKSETYRSAERYRPDLEARQRRLMSYVVKQLADHGISQNIIEEYKYVQQCRNALQQLDNLAASRDQNGSHRVSMRTRYFDSLHASMKSLRSCDSITYIQSVKTAIPPQKGFVRNTVIIRLLRKEHVISAYFLNRIINFLRFIVEKYRITEKLERRMKGRI